MQLLSSTFPAMIFVIAMVWAMVRADPQRGVALFLCALPFGAMAAVNLPAIGNTSVILADLGVLVLFTLVMLHPQGPHEVAKALRPGQPGFWLALFMVCALIVTLFAPRIFEGATEVFSIGRSTDRKGTILRPLEPRAGNISQLFRIGLGLLIYLALAALLARAADMARLRRAMVALTLLQVGLGLLDILSQSGGFAWIMAPLRTANYAMLNEHAFFGIKRMVGGFPEASSYGYLSIALFGFWFRHVLGDRTGRLAPAMLALSTFALVRSTSSSAYVACAAFLVLMSLSWLLWHRHLTVSRRLARMVAVAAALLPVAILTAVLSYTLSPGVADILDRLLFDKMASHSGVERMGWNAQALRNLVDTWFLGAGLGSLRASNWLVACLATTGLLGAALFCGFVLSFFRLSLPPARHDATPGIAQDQRLMLVSLQAGSLAMFLSAQLNLPSPNLELHFFAMAGIAAGLCRNVQRNRTQDRSRAAVFRSVRGAGRGETAPA